MLSFFIFIKLTLPSAVPSRVQGALRFHRPRLPRLQTRCRQELHHQSNPFSPPGRWPPSAEPPVHLQLLWSAYRSECIRRSIKRICTVQQRFHLPAHLIIINWRYKHNDIGAPHIFRQRDRIVSITQWWRFWQARHPLQKAIDFPRRVLVCTVCPARLAPSANASASASELLRFRRLVERIRIFLDILSPPHFRFVFFHFWLYTISPALYRHSLIKIHIFSWFFRDSV